MTFLDSPLNVACCVSLVSFLFKYYCSFLSTYVKVPQAVTKGNKEAIWWNIFVSLTHSTISSVILIYSCLEDANFTSDMEHHHSKASLIAAIFSFGYFIHDSLHILMTHPIKDNVGIMFHHAIMLTSLGKVLHDRKYINIVCIALFCEISSVFLHIRQLIKMMKTLNDTLLFLIISIVNVLAYMAVRFSVIIYLYDWFFHNYQGMEKNYRRFYFVMLSLMTIVNMVYFVIIMQKDFLNRFCASRKAKDE